MTRSAFDPDELARLRLFIFDLDGTLIDGYAAIGDALALTFAHRVARRDTKQALAGTRGRVARDVDYPIFDGV